MKSKRVQRVLRIAKRVLGFVGRRVVDWGIGFAMGCVIAFLFGGPPAVVAYAHASVGLAVTAC